MKTDKIHHRLVMMMVLIISCRAHATLVASLGGFFYFEEFYNAYEGDKSAKPIKT